MSDDDEIVKKYEGMALKQIAAEMNKVRDQLDEASGIKNALQNEWDILRKNVIPAEMEKAGIESVRLDGVGTVSLATDAYCSTPAEKRQELFDWLLEHDFGDLITETVNASTLKAFIKEQMMDGNEVPEMVKFTPYTYAKITGRPKG